MSPGGKNIKFITSKNPLWTVKQDTKLNGYRCWFPKLLSDNHLEVAGSSLTAGE